MAPTHYDVAALGNAIVDVLAHADDDFLAANALTKGAMTLIDEYAAADLYDRMGPGVECSGGSAANTVAALAMLGGRAAFVGKVRDDQLGEVFGHDIGAAGVHFATPAATTGPATARCLILVTPDAQRTMQTYLGAAQGLTPDDVDPELIASARVTYLEGYLWDPPQAKEAFVKAALSAHQAERQVALSLSDPFCVDRHRKSFLDLVTHHVDILFANEDEIRSLYQVDTFDEALQATRQHCRIAALTRSEKGSVVVAGDEVHVLDAEAVERVADTTGAGDAYAAGFLYGLTRDRPLGECARIGGVCAAEVISHVGARPEVPLADIVRRKLG